MNKELEQQAREWWRKRHMEYQYSPKREHILPSTDFQMESDLAAFAAHLEAQSKPIQGEVATVPLSPEMVEKMVEEFLGWMSDEFDTQGLRADESPGHELAHQRLRTRLLAIR